MTAEYVAPTRARLFELADELFQLGRGDDKPFMTVGGPDPLGKVPIAFATARHAVETAHAAVDLIRVGNELVAMTLVRASLECTITALWLVQSPEAVFGFMAEDIRGRRALSKDLAKSVQASIRDGAPHVAHINDDTVETIAAPQAKNFQQLTNSLIHGHEAYIHYRILSGLVHPCANLADFYLDPNEQAAGGLTLRYEPRAIGHDAWLFLAISCMTWANRAVDHLDVDHVHRSRLRAIARELGVPQTLELTPEAEQAVVRQQQERRRAARRHKPAR